MSCASFLAFLLRDDGGPNDRSAVSAVSKYFAALALSAASEERKSTSRLALWIFMAVSPEASFSGITMFYKTMADVNWRLGASGRAPVGRKARRRGRP